MRNQQIAQAIILDGETTSNVVNVEGFAWMFVEVPSGDESTAVTVQVLSGDGSTYIDAFAIDDVTNQIKVLTSEELATFGPMRMIKLKVGSGVSGDKTYYCHMST